MIITLRPSMRLTADDGGVVGEGAVAGEFLELVAERLDVIQRVRARGWRASCGACRGVRSRKICAVRMRSLSCRACTSASTFTAGPVLAARRSWILASGSAMGCSKSRVVRIHLRAVGRKGKSVAEAPRRSRTGGRRAPRGAVSSPTAGRRPAWRYARLPGIAHQGVQQFGIHAHRLLARWRSSSTRRSRRHRRPSAGRGRDGVLPGRCRSRASTRSGPARAGPGAVQALRVLLAQRA